MNGFDIIEPHIGHLYTSLIADTIARWNCLKDKRTKIKLTTGTDEHGSKIQQASAKYNLTPKEYCDRIVQSYHNLAQCFNIYYTNFTRTTDDTHVKTVQKFWVGFSNTNCQKLSISKSSLAMLAECPHRKQTYISSKL